MKTKAKVILVCKDTSLIAAETATGEIAVFELLGCEKVRVGNVLLGYWTELDNQVIYNESRETQLEVFIHDYGAEFDVVKKQYFTAQLPPVPATGSSASESLRRRVTV